MREAGRRRVRRVADSGIGQRPWRQVVNHLPPTEPLSADQVEKIHDSSLRILEEIGIEFLHPQALEILAAAGAEVTPGSPQVRLDRGLVLEMVAKAPGRFTLHARNPAHDLVIGGDVVNFATVGSTPNSHDRAGGRRPGNFQDYTNFLKLGQSLNCIHIMGGYPVEPVDLPPETRHLDCLAAFVTLTDKTFHAYSLGHTRITDGIEIARIARGISMEQLQREPSLFTIVNSNSPLRLDGPMLEGIMAMARAGQLMVLTPFTLAGAMAPATIAGALTLQNAEALAGIAFSQMVKAGAPCAYGGFTSNVDMKSGAPAFGTPEYVKATLAGGQLARRYGLPYRSSNANAANTVDAQAAYESMMSLQAAVMGHANIVMHAAGWLEGGLVASFEKMVLDAELIQMMAETVAPVVVDDDAIGLDAIREVGPGGHFFGSAHTLARYETAFYPPIVSDWRNSKQWAEAGEPTAYDRCEKLVGQILDSFEPPPLDPAIAEELAAFVARRKQEGGARS
ncbi:trimethylamine methyltransferase family protein [Geminicoccus roseus]|uniref:trimethylamine methyltransferase family protein n=1 Tax=Geminicoccus roseus TaxID=404900 RepID=UPI0004248573|nr:trimethylamine methyltransferase family protein [Geminicoccus roseus]